MKSIILALLVLCRVASAQVSPVIVTDQSLTGKGSTSSPMGVRLAVGGGIGDAGGTTGLSMLTSCSGGQVLKWNGSAWACAAAGAITGTQNHLIKVDSTGLAGVDSSTVDNGTNVTFVEPILSTLPSAAPATGTASGILTLVSTVEPSTARWAWTQSEVYEPDPVPYFDKTIQLGFNHNGASVDATQGAAWMQGESKFDDDGAGPDGYQTEWHFSSAGTDGIEHRWISHEAKWNNSDAATTFTGMRESFVSWDGLTTLMTLSDNGPANLQLNTTFVQHSDSAAPFSIVKQTGGASILTIGTAGGSSNLSTSFGISVVNTVPLSITNPSGAVNLVFDAVGGSKEMVISEQANGTMQIENRATSTGALNIYADGPLSIQDDTLGQVARFAVFANETRSYGNARFGSAGVLGWSSATANSASDTGIARNAAGVMEVNNGTAGAFRDIVTRATFLNGTTKLNAGTGVPAINCAIGDEFSRTDGAAGTTLYSCTAINTWTAMGGGAGTITGTGTANTTTKFTGASAIGNAWALDDGTTWGVSAKFTITEATGAFVASGTGSIGGALNMNSNKITSLTNGSSAQDAAAFGQLATAVNAAVSGTSGRSARFSGTNVVGNGAFTDDGTNATIGGTFGVTGLATLSGAISVSGGVSNFLSDLGVAGKLQYTDQLIDHGTLFGIVSGTAQNVKGSETGTFTASGTTETITFGVGFTTTPTCVISTDGTIKGYSYSRSTTQLTFTSLTNAQKYDFVCIGH